MTAIPHSRHLPRLVSLVRRGLPAVIALLLAAAGAVLIALTHTKERHEAMTTVVADALLAKVSIEFQLNREAEALQKLAVDVGRRLPQQALSERFDGVMRRAGQVQALFVVETGQVPLIVERGPEKHGVSQIPPAVLEATLAKAVDQERAVASPVFDSFDGPAVAVAVPPPASFSTGPSVVAVYSLKRLLAEMVPWHLAQDYEFTVADADGTVHARRIASGPGRATYQHREAMEFAGSKLILGLDSVRGAPGWVANVLRVGILALALVLSWSLWAWWRDHRHRRAAERLAGEEAALRRAIGDCSVIGVCARDLDGRVRYVNPALSRMVGQDAKEMLGSFPPPNGWLPPLDGDYRAHLEQHRSAGDTPRPFETRLARRDGSAFSAAIYDAPLLDAQGTHVGWTSSIVDLTQQRQFEERERLQEERLQTVARLTTMGELASTLAHELNQPLGAIASYLGGSLKMLRDGRDDTNGLIGALGKASEQTQRAGHVIQRIREFVRKREPRRSRTSLPQVVDSCRTLIELQAKREGTTLEFEERPGADVAVSADAIMLQQVILNLTRNAIEAMSRLQPGARRLVVTIQPEGEGVRLSVRDVGQGIPASDVAGVFEPFFTTKAEGMGMGLSICRSTVLAHGGRLWFDRCDPGTEFHAWLPRIP